VHGDGVVELVGVDLLERAEREDPRVVDEDVEAPEPFDGVVDGGRDGGGVGAVGPHRETAPAECLDVPHHRGRALLCREVGEGHVGAVAGEPQCDRGPDAAAAAGHEGHPAGEVGHRRVHSVVVAQEVWSMVAARVKRYV
jgi:hypothetical protein